MSIDTVPGLNGTVLFMLSSIHRPKHHRERHTGNRLLSHAAVSRRFPTPDSHVRQSTPHELDHFTRKQLPDEQSHPSPNTPLPGGILPFPAALAPGVFPTAAPFPVTPKTASAAPPTSSRTLHATSVPATSTSPTMPKTTTHNASRTQYMTTLRSISSTMPRILRERKRRARRMRRLRRSGFAGVEVDDEDFVEEEEEEEEEDVADCGFWGER